MVLLSTEGKQDLPQSYFRYLTERLDNGTSKNLVPPTVARLCRTCFSTYSDCRMLDVGCFNGSMLNRILMILPDEIRLNITCIGLDKDSRILSIGSQQHPNIDFICGSLEYPLPFEPIFHIVILSNILHELYSAKRLDFNSDSAAKVYVRKAIIHTCQVIANTGYLVILEGVLPVDPQKLVTIEFRSKNALHEFKYFCSSFVFPISFITLGESSIQISLRHLAAFLTKARYLQEDYWPIEATQIYQFLTEQEFHEILFSAGMIIEESRKLPQPSDEWKHKFTLLGNSYSYPPKNILIVAKKK